MGASPRPKLLLLANRNASRLASAPEKVDAARRLLERAGASVETRLTETIEEMEVVLAEDLERRVALLGGDGTLHAVANAPVTKPELALLPAGGANNVARSLGIPVDVEAAARLAVSGRAGPVDAIAAWTEMRSYLAVEGVSVGFHAVARSGYHGKNSTDTPAAIRAGVAAVARFQPFAVCLRLDGESEIVPISQLFVTNTALFGPGLRVAPSADSGDGLLEVTVIEARSRASLLRLIPHLRRGTHVAREGVRTMQAQRIRIATRGRSPVVADTTNLGSEPVDLAVVPGALAIVRPA